MGVDKEELSCRCTKTFKGHFLKSQVISLSTFKAELPSHCSLTVVYDIPLCSSESLLLSNVKNKIKTLFHILPRKTELSRLVTYELVRRQKQKQLFQSLACQIIGVYKTVLTNPTRFLFLCFSSALSCDDEICSRYIIIIETESYFIRLCNSVVLDRPQSGRVLFVTVTILPLHLIQHSQFFFHSEIFYLVSVSPYSS